MIDVLKNNDFEILDIIFRNLMILRIPKRYIKEFKISDNPEKVIFHYNMSYPTGKPVDIEELILNDISIILDRKYCSNLYSINGSDYFSPIPKNRNKDKYDYTAEMEVSYKTITHIKIRDKKLKLIYPDYCVLFNNDEENWGNELQSNEITDNEIRIKIKE